MTLFLCEYEFGLVAKCHAKCPNAMVKKTFYESDGRVREVGFRVFRGRESSAWAITWIWCMQYLLVLFWWVFTNKLCYLLIRVSIIDTSILQWFFVNSGGEFSVPELFLRVFFYLLSYSGCVLGHQWQPLCFPNQTFYCTNHLWSKFLTILLLLFSARMCMTLFDKLQFVI